MDVDRRILKELEANSRASNIEIAKKLNISEGTVRNRIQKLIDKKIIRRFTIEISTKEGFFAVVLVKSQSQVNTTIIVNKIKKIDGIKNVYEVAGEFDIIIEVTTESSERFNDIIEKIRSIEGILETKSLTVLKIN